MVWMVLIDLKDQIVFTWYVAVCPASMSDRPEMADAVLYHVTTTAASARNIEAPATPSKNFKFIDRR